MTDQILKKCLSLWKPQKPKPTETLPAGAKKIYEESKQKLYIRTDRMFVVLTIVQWLFGILCALVISPRTWLGSSSEIHIHLWASFFLGTLIAILPIYMGLRCPGTPMTRHTIAFSQMMYSALLIHLMVELKLIFTFLVPWLF